VHKKIQFQVAQKIYDWKARHRFVNWKALTDFFPESLGISVLHWIKFFKSSHNFGNMLQKFAELECTHVLFAEWGL